jgi:RimK family alpha-L-glutamate ligase
MGDSTELPKAVEAFREAFGPECVVHSDRLVLGVEGGRLTLHDLEGRSLRPPLVAHTRMSTPRIQTDRELILLDHLQAMGTVLFNSADAYLNCTNKFRQLQKLASAGLPVADTHTYVDAPLEQVIDVRVPDPCVVKATRGNQGSRVFMATKEMLRDVHGNLLNDVPYLFQEYLSFSHGRDLRVVVVDGRPVGSLIRSNQTGGFKSNLAQGGTGEPCLGRFPGGEKLAVQVTQAVDAVLAGVDLLFEPDGTFTVCEVNPNPDTRGLPQVIPAIIGACKARVDAVRSGDTLVG